MSSLPSITDEDLASTDVSVPLPVENSPVLQKDPEKARLLQAKIGNPLELQQFNAIEIRAAIDEKIKKDMAELGFLSTDTLKWMEKMNTILSDLHKNMYGTKSMQVSVQGKITHAQIASLMRSAESEGRAPAVDVPSLDEEQG